MNHDQVVCIGVGGAGGNIASTLAEEKIFAKDLFVINTDKQALDRNTIQNKILIGEQTVQGRGSGASPELGSQAFEESKQRIIELISANKYYVVFGGLGGGTGSGVIPELAKLLNDQGKNCVVIVSLPFSFEGIVQA